jgi:RNA polymerase sigma-70 factor (ECF subfamily)
MSICDGQQRAETPTQPPRQPHDDFPSPALIYALTPERQPTCAGKASPPPPGLPDTVKGEYLAYAVCPATTSRPGSLSTLAFGGQDRRLVSECVSDELLLKSVSEGNKAAMHIFFARHRMKVVGSIQQVARHPAVVRDLVGHIFLDVWQSANRFDRRARVSIWLFQIACFKATGARRPQSCKQIDNDDARRISSAAARNQKEPYGILQACISRLSPAHREIIEMIYFREKSITELSELLDIPYAAVRGRLFCARKQLARMLAVACVTSAPN